MTEEDPTVIAYDPGGVTGWAVISVHPDALLDPDCYILDNITHFSCGQFIGNEFEHVDQMLWLADYWPSAGLVVEDFILRKFDMSRNLLAPVRLTAAFRYTLMPERFVHIQAPQLAKTTVTDARLRAMGFWEQTAGAVHARDAIRHVLTFYKRLKSNPKLLKETFPELVNIEEM